MLEKKFNEVIKDLTSNMKSPKDTEYAKRVVTDLTLTYLDQINQLTKSYENKIHLCNLRVADLEQRIQSLEEEIFEDDDESNYLSILCPYCNASVMIDSSSEEKEIECPECNNLIELDWDSDNEDDIM